MSFDPPRTEDCEAILIRRRKQSVDVQSLQPPFLPKRFVLCERSSGAVRFHVDAEPDGRMPVEKIASLLAVHCLVRGQAPEDFELLVVPREPLLDAPAERAQELLAAGRALGAGIKVSRREGEVLDGILQNLANKEIAVRLNVSERTVKFHVSSLLAKFGVTDRVALSREAALGRMPGRSPAGILTAQNLFGFPVSGGQALSEPDPSAVRESAAEQPTRQAGRTRSHLLPMYPRERFAT